jgi:hypothetical protein
MRSEPISKSQLPDSNRLGPTHLSIWWHFIHRNMATKTLFWNIFYQQKSDANTHYMILPSRIRIHQPKGRVHQQFTNRKLEFCHQNRWILAIQNHRLVTAGLSRCPLEDEVGPPSSDPPAMLMPWWSYRGMGHLSKKNGIYTYYILIYNYIYIYVQSWLAGKSPTNK